MSAEIEVPKPVDDPRYISLVERIAALDAEQIALDEQITETKADQAAARHGTGSRQRALMQWYASGGDPAKKPPDVPNHEQVLLGLQEQLRALGQARELLVREQQGLLRTISREVIDRFRPEYLALVRAIYKAGLALVEAIEHEETFIASFQAASVNLSGLPRITLDLSRDQLRRVKQDVSRHFSVDLDEPPPRASSPAKGRKAEAVTAS
jgi:hypothetical protein